MDGRADENIKPDLLRDLFRLIDFEPYDVFNEKKKIWNKRSRVNPGANPTGVRSSVAKDRNGLITKQRSMNKNEQTIDRDSLQGKEFFDRRN